MPLRSPFLLLALAFASGCNPVESLVEREIERELPGVIGPADGYEVDVAGLRTSTGEAERVTVLGRRVRPAGAPVLDRLDLELLGVRYDRDARRLDRVEHARATARVLPADLAPFLDTHRNVRDPAITLRPPDGATLRFRPEAGGFAVPEGVAVEMTGRLVAEAGRVRFDVSEVRAAGIDLGATVARRLSEAIDPIVDLTDTRARLQVTAVRVEAGAVVAEATGDLSGLSTR
ncbi:MAG TPA: DUF2993 domain-containing protein [Rubricoccaceae bacterium]|nr:DUF2993 domain-containing protein [Rubricoccaceae bacterium]